MKISDLPNYASLEKVVFEESFKKFEPTTLSSFFKELNSLTSISGLENLNTTHVTDMSKMFYNCYNLSSLNLSQFNTGNVEKMNEMFYNCHTLNSLDLSAFNTAKVNNMYRMFYYCFVRTIDLSSFNTANVENMDEMFAGASLVVNIYTSESFKTDKLTTSKYMFYLCTKLPNFYKDEVDATHANYGAGGYFKKIVGQKGNVTLGANGEPLAVAELTLTDDDEDFKAYESFIATSASYRRTLKEGTTWATLCLPFEVSLEGQNFRAFKLLSADDAKKTVELEEIETNIEAGTPVIIKMKDGETKLKFSVANKAIAKDVLTSESADGNYQLHGLYTQKEFSKDADNNCYIVKGNKLMNPAKLLANTNVEKVVSKPFRAYMVEKSSAPAGAKMFSIGISDSTTAIDSLNTIANDKAEYYDLQGKRLNEPQKGINIVKRGGKTMKVIIK